MSDLIVARVRRPHGVAGEVLISIDTDRPGHVFRPGRVLQLADDRGEPLGRSVVLERMRPTTGGAIVRFEGVATREDAGRLRGHALLIGRSEAAPADQDEIHYQDLIGLMASADGADLGPVSDILEVPSGQLLVFRRDGGKEVLIPFVKEMIDEIDLSARTLKLKLPDGMLEI